jgi:hypothetical protein
MSDCSTLGSQGPRSFTSAARPGCGSVGRYYDPATGQFISVDPAVDQTEAPYAYVDGDPVDNTDPLGLGCFLGICTHSFDPMASLDAIVNLGRGATFGLTDQIANWIVPGASCTVPQDSLDQFIGGAATTLLGGEALGALLRSGRLGDLLAQLRSIDWADETGSTGLGRSPDTAVDASGKVHGDLPSVEDLSRYNAEELEILLGELKMSVQTRIAKTVELGADYGHSARIVEEQRLIQTIESHLADR